MAKKCGRQLKVLQLWHGTGKTDPRVIIKSESGLNINYANDGLWGKGIYFAVNANYSCPTYSYPFTGLSSVYEVLVCEVIIGESTNYVPYDRSLKAPPKNPESKQPYDSVKGNSEGSDIYVVY